MDNTVTKLWRVAGVDAAVHGLVRLRDGGRRSLASHLLGTAVRQLRHYFGPAQDHRRRVQVFCWGPVLVGC